MTFRSPYEIPTCKLGIHVIILFLSDNCLS